MKEIALLSIFAIFLVSAIGAAQSSLQCTINASTPYVITVHSGGVGPPHAGERLVISTTITSTCSQNQSVTVITEARTSDGITEHIGLQSIQTNQTSEIGDSWVPFHGGPYQLRAFVIDNIDNPEAVSQLSTSNLTVSSVDGISVISILPAPYLPIRLPGFYPQNITVVDGINNTVWWTDGDTSDYVLIGKQISGGNETIKFSYSGYVETDGSISCTFVSPGLYKYWNKNNPLMYGFVRVIIVGQGYLQLE